MSDETPVVFGTRHAGSSDPALSIDASWPWYRRLISWGARMLAVPLVGSRVSDPMTGLFGLTRAQYRTAKPLNAQGFKIFLELLLKTDPKGAKSAQGVPYAFAARTQGASKLSGAVIIKYIIHLLSLYRYALGFFGLTLLWLVLIVVCHYGWIVGEQAWATYRQRVHGESFDASTGRRLTGGGKKRRLSGALPLAVNAYRKRRDGAPP